MTNKEPEVLSVSVSDAIKPGEAIGNPPEKTSPLLRYIPWTNKPSRPVVEEDLPRVIKESTVLAELCHTNYGIFSGANAVSHCQIEDNDPLRFFVSSSGEIVVNPIIVSHTKIPVDSIEACTSFPTNPPKTVQRYHKLRVKFQQITLEKTLSEPREEDFSGPEAKVIQHEISHFNGHGIYDEVISPEDAIGETLLIATQVKE